MKKGELYEKDDRILADAMHTMKNMISPIIAYSEMIQYGHVEPEKIPEVAKKIGYCASNVTQVCTDLVEIYRLRGNLVNKTVEKVCPYEVLQECLYMIESSLNPKKIKLVNRLDKAVAVLFNFSMLRSLFMKLINNSIKFSPEGSSIEISGKIVDENTYEISVKDEGVGIDEAKIEEKLKNNTDYSTPGLQNEEGTGLGLLLVKIVLDKHQGTLRAYNNKDKGCTFVFTLPLYKEN
ncbi:MAG: HAMP domain-containing histidine kinase [Bacteroidales bacterium]|nr:HAMP domain-containing histidine kinase [Bacteroidales bacterium]